MKIDSQKHASSGPPRGIIVAEIRHAQRHLNAGNDMNDNGFRHIQQPHELAQALKRFEHDEKADPRHRAFGVLGCQITFRSCGGIEPCQIVCAGLAFEDGVGGFMNRRHELLTLTRQCCSPHPMSEAWDDGLCGVACEAVVKADLLLTHFAEGH